MQNSHTVLIAAAFMVAMFGVAIMASPGLFVKQTNVTPVETHDQEQGYTMVFPGNGTSSKMPGNINLPNMGTDELIDIVNGRVPMKRL